MRYRWGEILVSPRGIAWLIASILLFAAIIAIPASSTGSLSRPSYSAGDRWIYHLDGSVDSFPGANTTQTGQFAFHVVGRVDMTVIGPASVQSGGRTIAAVRVDTRTTGFLNGSFLLPIGGSAQISGSFTTTSTEFWESQSYLPVQSNATTAYNADVTTIFTVPLVASIRVNASTSILSVPPFDLDVGQSATAALDTRLVANTTVSFAGQTQSFENRTNASSIWRRQVVSQESVRVEAGTFSTYKLNQTLGSFPGITGGAFGGGNETAYYSNDTGNYVRRDAYANGTRVAGMQLQSYSFGARPSGLTIVDWLLIVVAVAVGSFLVLFYWRRRKERRPMSPSNGPPAKVEENGGTEHRPR